jgi:hypothetical protein
LPCEVSNRTHSLHQCGEELRTRGAMRGKISRQCQHCLKLTAEPLSPSCFFVFRRAMVPGLNFKKRLNCDEVSEDLSISQSSIQHRPSRNTTDKARGIDDFILEFPGLGKHKKRGSQPILTRVCLSGTIQQTADCFRTTPFLSPYSRSVDPP